MKRQALWLAGGVALVAVTSAIRMDHAGRATAAEVRQERGGAVWGADYFPNVPLTDQHGRVVHFFDDLIRDKVVAINFVYTTCPDSCPLETARLQQVYRLLRERMGQDVFFYSITIDPVNDTPTVLAEFAEKWEIGPGWSFRTGRSRTSCSCAASSASTTSRATRRRATTT